MRCVSRETVVMTISFILLVIERLVLEIPCRVLEEVC